MHPEKEHKARSSKTNRTLNYSRREERPMALKTSPESSCKTPSNQLIIKNFIPTALSEKRQHSADSLSSLPGKGKGGNQEDSHPGSGATVQQVGHLHAANLGSTPSIPYCPPTLPGVTSECRVGLSPEHSRVWPQNKIIQKQCERNIEPHPAH